tara:strand:- start:109 stop:573 length:465 start_codon:yes stop_codon:yes gene_type:complete
MQVKNMFMLIWIFLLILQKQENKFLLNFRLFIKKKIDELKKIEDELKKGEAEIINQKNVISEEEFDKKLSELRKKANEYQKERNNSTKSISEKRIKATKELLSLIQPILTQFANDNSISIIIQKKAIVIGKSESDITNQILKILNTKHKKINLN